MHVIVSCYLFKMLLEVRWNGKNLVVVHVLCMYIYECLETFNVPGMTLEDATSHQCSQYVCDRYSYEVPKANFRNAV